MNYIEVSITEIDEIVAEIDIFGEAKTDTQSKTVVPSREQQVVLPDSGFLLDSVIVEPIPENYGLVTYNGYSIRIS